MKKGGRRKPAAREREAGRQGVRRAPRNRRRRRRRGEGPIFVREKDDG